MDVTISVAARIRRLAASQPDRVVLRQVALDGSEPTLTWAELDDRSSTARPSSRPATTPRSTSTAADRAGLLTGLAC